MLTNQEEYQKMSEVEEHLWWYRILHGKVLRNLQRVSPSKELRILDAGCGTGGLLLFLKKNGYTNCKGMDVSEHALHYASARGLDVRQGSVDQVSTSFPGEQFDVIISNDVLYFFEPDTFGKIFSDWNKVLPDGGHIFLNLPALEAFKGMHDVSVGITYRISFQTFRNTVAKTGFKIAAAHYWPFFLSPLIYIARLRQRRRMKHKDVKIQSDVSLPNRFINGCFYWLTRAEAIIPGRKWGSSLSLVLQKIQTGRAE